MVLVMSLEECVLIAEIVVQNILAIGLPNLVVVLGQVLVVQLEYAKTEWM
tara:strand:- start:401 stop:550 length:150 start_codon:yes stop_codon:yes gene_type:complete